VVEHRVAPLDWLFVALSFLGYVGLVWIALAPLFAWRSGRPALVSTALIAGTVWAADLLAVALKAAVDRPRPYRVVAEADPLLRTDIGASFPSGHAATSFAGAVLLAYLFRRSVPALLALAVLVAVSRVYVGVHYPLDVIGGAVLGTAVAAVVVGAIRVRPLTSRARPRSGGAPPGG
jgi:undecaprenyl-diphosphatase